MRYAGMVDSGGPDSSVRTDSHDVVYGNPSSRECYVDTSALVAFLDRSDTVIHDTYPAPVFLALPRLVTSALVVYELEGHAWFLRRVHMQRAMDFLRASFASLKPLTVLPFGQDQIESVHPLLLKFGDQGATMADVHGLSIMRTRKIRTCWSTRSSLALTGVRLLAL